MGSLSQEEEFPFFDCHEEIVSTSAINSDGIEIVGTNTTPEDLLRGGLPYDVWIGCPGSVMERRSKFFNWMEEGLSGIGQEKSVDVCSSEGGVDRVRLSSGAVLRTPGFEDEFCSTRSSMSYWSNDYSEMSEDLRIGGDFVCREGNFGGEMLCDVDESGEDSKVDECTVMGSEQYVAGVESDSASTSSPFFRHLLDKEVGEKNKLMGVTKRGKKGWLSRLRSIACIVDGQDRFRCDDDDTILGHRVQRIKVRQYRKQSKELSALYKGQDIRAHQGSILTMKFSPDGQFLASAGEDRIVRVWQVVEDERSNERDIPEIDPSCIYFSVNHLSELKPFLVDKEKTGKSRNMKKTSESACVIFPPKIFRILEKPLHEFHGHNGDVLDLSWSKNNHLLSCSVDKAVRLWRVGCDHCLGVFSHSNYVTCAQFNPIDDNYFISGSIDGKVRIWAISGCQVVDWTDIREIVTAVCYRPDGQGGIVGSLTGNCRFYSISDNHLQLDAQICLHGKKKSPFKRITSFQFSPQDNTKLMVTCADSQVRILDGLNVIGKYRGPRNSGNQISASFTADGKHLISACEDSNVYMWNCIDQEESAPPQVKNIRSFERFSADASIAIPWFGLQSGNSENRCQFGMSDGNSHDSLPFFSPSRFPLSQELLLESFPKGSATWPEEKLPSSSPLSSPSMHKSQFKFLKASYQSTSSSHAWGMVIVTAGWDGRIRSFHNYGLPVPV